MRSNEGRLRLDEVSGCVARVFENAARIKTLVSEVHLGSKEQARGIEQIARAVTQMQQLTQSTAASAEQGASAGEEMSAQAQSLQDSVRRLHELVGVDEEGAAISRAVQVRPALVSKSAPAAVATPPSKRAQIPLDDDFRDF